MYSRTRLFLGGEGGLWGAGSSPSDETDNVDSASAISPSESLLDEGVRFRVRLLIVSTGVLAFVLAMQDEEGSKVFEPDPGSDWSNELVPNIAATGLAFEGWSVSPAGAVRLRGLGGGSMAACSASESLEPMADKSNTSPSGECSQTSFALPVFLLVFFPLPLGRPGFLFWVARGISCSEPSSSIGSSSSMISAPFLCRR